MERSQQPAEVSVDLGMLRVFADSLKSDAELGLRPGVARATREALTGVPFGSQSIGGEAQAARKAVTVALARAQHNAAKQIEAADILIKAVNHILTNYTNADLATAEQIAAVEKTLSDAVKASEQVYPIPRGQLAE
ncbi:hypothetical protein [Catellatospora sichuanensis]|uniref:hypothetical protein n=1 Tax=Catellatospora sichuanensis TaxID=1969805 RepID=UPI001183B347|nr:hypothetical protein [Catellatospora sichuanensis]